MGSTNDQIEAIKKMHAAGDTESAKKAYLEILRVDPNNVAVLHLLAILYAEQGQLEAAKEKIQFAMKINPNDVSLPLNFANILKASGDTNAALEVLQTLIKAHPDFAAGYNNLGTILYSQQKWQAAIDAFHAAINTQANYIDAYYNLGLALLKIGKQVEAENTFKAVLELSPHHPGALFQLGRLSMQSEKMLNAIENFLAVESNYPHHLETQINLGTCFLVLNHLVQAEQHYLKAQQLAPEDLQVLFNLGVIARARGHDQQALQFYIKAIAIDPDFFAAHNNIAAIYLSQRNKSKAVLHFREALRIQPNNIPIWHTILFLTQDESAKFSPPEYIQTLFDAYAEHYDAHVISGLHYRVPENLLRIVSEQKVQQLNILDLGCGTGLCAAAFKDLTKSIVGVDLSKDMLKIARQKNLYQDLIQKDIMSFLQSNTHQYDLVLAADVLEYFGDLNPLFQQIAKVLTPGGLFAFNTEINTKLSYQLTETGRFTHLRSYIDETAQQAGFSILKYEEIILRSQADHPVKGHLYLLQH